MGVKTELTGDWLERFNDVEKFNTYASDNKVNLSDVIIKDKTTTGIILTGAKFSNTEWEKVDFSNSHITNSVFEDSEFTDVKFKSSTLTDVVFKNCKFTSSSFSKSKLVNVKFINCDFFSTGFFKLSGSKVEFQDVDFEKVDFDRSQAILTFSGSKFVNTDFTSLTPPSSLTFTKSDLDVDFSRSKIDKLEITESELHEPGGGNLTIKELILKDIKGDRIAFDDSYIKRATIENTDLWLQGLGFADTQIDDLLVINSKDRVVLLGGKIGKARILNSNLRTFYASEATAESIYISGTTIKEGKFEKLKAKKLEFENVTIDGKMNFKDAQVDQFINKNTTQTPKAVIDLTGSNIKF
ncbi:MAG: pentapeptide repeat-containing protein [Gammaproteobacteria bacterium]